MNFKYLFIALAVFSAAFLGVAKASVCEKYIGTCDYYLCQENEFNCGSEGYFINYGHHFCSKFYAELDDKLSLDGKKWLSKVAVCLQKKMENQNLHSSCKEVTRNAYSIHSDCYLSADYCHLSFEDKVKILKFLRPELIKFKTQREGLQVFYSCLKNKM